MNWCDGRGEGAPCEPRLIPDLNPGEALRSSESTTTGNLGQKDVECYDVVDAQGQTAGTVVYTAATSLKPPFRTSYSLAQKDGDGNVILEEQW